ncbi:MAG: hypothetical protein HYS34_02485 [Acidobacteria bacterium]|nr:hypothetical protein [Acidobacteriota bacterium]
MQGLETGRWEAARKKVIVRWREILDRIDARDEGGVLGLANVIDEFCEEAMALRADAMRGQDPKDPGLLKYTPDTRPVGTRCMFCRGFQEAGGCFGVLGSLNKLVLDGKWEEARGAAEGYLGRLETMEFTELSAANVH